MDGAAAPARASRSRPAAAADTGTASNVGGAPAAGAAANTRGADSRAALALGDVSNVWQQLQALFPAAPSSKLPAQARERDPPQGVVASPPAAAAPGNGSGSMNMDWEQQQQPGAGLDSTRHPSAGGLGANPTRHSAAGSPAGGGQQQQLASGGGGGPAAATATAAHQAGAGLGLGLLLERSLTLLAAGVSLHCAACVLARCVLAQPLLLVGAPLLAEELLLMEPHFSNYLDLDLGLDPGAEVPQRQLGALPGGAGPPSGPCGVVAYSGGGVGRSADTHTAAAAPPPQAAAQLALLACLHVDAAVQQLSSAGGAVSSPSAKPRPPSASGLAQAGSWRGREPTAGAAAGAVAAARSGCAAGQPADGDVRLSAAEHRARAEVLLQRLLDSIMSGALDNRMPPDAACDLGSDDQNTSASAASSGAEEQRVEREAGAGAEGAATARPGSGGAGGEVPQQQPLEGAGRWAQQQRQGQWQEQRRLMATYHWLSGHLQELGHEVRGQGTTRRRQLHYMPSHAKEYRIHEHVCVRVRRWLHAMLLRQRSTAWQGVLYLVGHWWMGVALQEMARRGRGRLLLTPRHRIHASQRAATKLCMPRFAHHAAGVRCPSLLCKGGGGAGGRRWVRRRRHRQRPTRHRPRRRCRRRRQRPRRRLVAAAARLRHAAAALGRGGSRKDSGAGDLQGDGSGRGAAAAAGGRPGPGPCA